VVRVRRILAGALVAASDEDSGRAANCLSLAERALDAATIGSRNEGQSSGPEAVGARVHAITPAFNLARDLLTEGYDPAQRLVARAARLHLDRQYDEASMLLDVAAQLLSVSTTNSAAAPVPDWFTAMADAPWADSSPAEAKAWVKFCQSVAQGQTRSAPVEFMVQRARRSRDAGDGAAARWWASLALQSLGISDEAAAAGAQDAESRP
jgi:hypothetical protein